ncbi:AAA family ATPase [Halodesulfovibrio aestuarii]|uniref:Cellulose biosynthesis protein BcsQ n=1 Tax=Halodesulfovibrio aestuarii TaxID=126333 RepID=A0A8G2C8G5_9BACT|nr:cellulose synthase operon protein YhjQ/BcsQ [Halodesulfovibrio aestuarii]SHI81236.1 Cellulose biosynthesis protein BcsQ [Halodesulfovibrio aestuarii]
MNTKETTIGVSILVTDSKLSQELRSAVNATPGFKLIDEPTEDQHSVVLIEANGSQEQVLKEVSVLKNKGYVGGVFMTASNYQQDLLLSCIQMGVDEFLPSPLAPENFIAALQRYQTKHLSTLKPASSGKTIAVLGARGGVGTTTVAAGMATHFWNEGKTVALLDFSRPFGDISLFMDFEYEYSWKDAVTNLTRLDSTFLRSLMYPYSDTLQILSSPVSSHERNDLRSKGIQDVLFTAAESFDVVIIDAGSVHDNAALTILEHVNEPIIVSLMSLTSLSSANYILGLCKQVSPVLANKIKLIINRYSSKAIIENSEIQQITHKEIFAEIAEDHDKPLAAINRGLPLMQAYPNCSSSKDIRALARRLTEKDHATKKGFFGIL